jgi:hypothetical protein
VLYNVTKYPTLSQPNHVKTIDFAHLWPVMRVGSNGTLTLKDIALIGLAPSDTPEVAQADIPHAPGLNAFPSILIEDGSTVRLHAPPAAMYACLGWSGEVHVTWCCQDGVPPALRARAAQQVHLQRYLSVKGMDSCDPAILTHT